MANDLTTLSSFEGGNYSRDGGLYDLECSDDSTTDKLYLELAAGRVGVVIFDDAEVRFMLQLFSSHVEFGKQLIIVNLVWSLTDCVFFS